MRAWLDSVSCISFGRSLEEFKPKTTDSVFSTTTEGSNLPLFLQDQGTFNAPQELLEKVKVSRIFENGHFKLWNRLFAHFNCVYPIISISCYTRHSLRTTLM